MIDSSFRELVNEKILDEKYRAISVPVGVDMLAVSKHIYFAQRLRLFRNLLLACLFVPALWYALGRVNAVNQPEHIPEGLILAYMSFNFFVAWLAVCLEHWYVRYRVIARSLQSHNFNPTTITLSRSVEADLRGRLSGFLSEEDCNVIVYSGFSPFIGSGFDIGGWSFALDTSKAIDDPLRIQKPVDFSVEEIYSYVTNQLADTRIQGMTLSDKIFINGQDLRRDGRFLPDIYSRPVSHIPSEDIQSFAASPSLHARHYKCIRILSWQGDIVLTVFLRFLKYSSNLFVEASFFLLPPLKPEYKKIDELRESPTLAQLGELLQTTFFVSLFAYPLSPLFLFANLVSPIQARRRQDQDRRLILQNPLFDYGASFSIREAAASTNYDRYFQKLDKEMFHKIIERKILDAITHFLDRQGIDTSDLNTRQNTILNNGVIVTGGSMEARNLTVGERAKSFVNGVTGAPGGYGAKQGRS